MPRRARAAAPAAAGPDVDDYVVRIYRWGAGAAGPPRHVVGVVEQVGAEGKAAFHTLDELWEILRSRRRSVARKREAEKGPDFWSTSAGRARSPGRPAAKSR